MKFCVKNIARILVISLFILAIIVPVISIADDYIITTEQPDNTSYSGSVSRYELTLNISIDKRARRIF